MRRGEKKADDPAAPCRAQEPGGGLRHRVVRHGIHRSLHLPDPALRPLARHERGRSRGAGGGRNLLALFLSIHVGVLMDRFGRRRVTLFFVWTAIALSPLFPLVPSFWPLMLLPILNGGALSFGWSGSQTLIAQ